MNERMIYLTALITAAMQKTRIKTNYTDRFKASGNTFTSPTDEIKVDEMMDYFAFAGVVEKGAQLPILGSDGIQRLTLKPDDIGSDLPYTALDILNIRAGVPKLTTSGQEISAIESVEAKKIKLGTAAMINTLEAQCAEAYLLGTYTDAAKQELTVGVKTNKTITFAKGGIAQKLLLEAEDWSTKKATGFPLIELGANVFGALRQELEQQGQNMSAARVTITEKGSEISIGALKITLLPFGIKKGGKKIDTSNMMIMSAPEAVGLGYACLTVGNVETNDVQLVQAEYVGGEERVTSQGKKGLFVKSSPMPFIIDPKKFVRYTVTIS